MKPEMVILCGLPGSGKSTIAKSEYADHFRINYDELRWDTDKPFSHEREKQMKKQAFYLCRDALNHGQSVVIDNTNLTEGARAPWFLIAKDYGIVPIIQEVNTPIAECVERDSHREGIARVGRAVIERMALFTGWIDWNDKQTYQRDFVICDVDGTLADLTHRKHFLEKPKNWLAFFNGVEFDKPIQPIVKLVDKLSYEFYILIVSGRAMDRAGLATEKWLNDQDIVYKHLFMRAGNDFRADDIVKKEILDLLPKDRIKYVLDDRDRVVKMWRDNGLTCLQVAPGNF